MDQPAAREEWRIVPQPTCPCPGRRRGALAAVNAGGRPAGVASFDGPDAYDWVELSLQLGPGRQPTAVGGELLRAVASLAASAGADRMVVRFDPRSRHAREVVDASRLDWQVHTTGNAARAEVALDKAELPAALRGTATASASAVRSHPRGITVLPSAEGPSPRSDPRWTAGRARRADRLLGRLVARGRSALAG